MSNMNHNNRHKEFVSKYEYKEEKKEQEKIREERYRANKRARARARAIAKRKAKEIKKRICLLLATGTIAVGSLTACNHFKSEKSNQIKIEQLLEDEDTAKNIGLDEELLEEYKNLREKVYSDNVDFEEMEDSISQIVDLQLKLMKIKVGNTTGESTNNIRLMPAISNNGENSKAQIKISNRPEIGKIDMNMQRYINDIALMQTLEGNIYGGHDLDKSDFKIYKYCIEDMEKLITSDIKIDNKGNLTMEKIKTSDIEKNKNYSDDFER